MSETTRGVILSMGGRKEDTTTKRKYAHRPKGSYPHPDGGYLVESSHVTKNGRRLKTIAHHKAEPDTKAIAEALVELAERLVKQEHKKKRP